MPFEKFETQYFSSRESSLESQEKKENLPQWIEFLKGAGHFHTELSGEIGTPGEARYSLEQIFQYLESLNAGKRGKIFEFFIVADHCSDPGNPRIISPQEGERFLEQKKEIEKLNERYRVKGIAGIEASIIGENGEIDLPDEIGEKMDLVIASMHALPKEKASQASPQELARFYEKAYLGAIENPHVDVLGHPTRHLSTEVLRQIDWDKIFKRARENGVAIEINLNNPMVPVWTKELPRRENYSTEEEYLRAKRDYLAHQEHCQALREVFQKAIQHRVKFFIGTDFHTLEQFWQPFRNFTDSELRIINEVISGGKITQREREIYTKEIQPRLEKLLPQEKDLILKVARGKLSLEERKMIDEERLSQNPGMRFWLRSARVISQLLEAGVKKEDVINSSRENLERFLKTPKEERKSL